jgi:hypothetical protein
MERRSILDVIPAAGNYFEIDCDDASTATTYAAYLAFIGEAADHTFDVGTVERAGYANPKLDISTHLNSAGQWKIVGVSRTMNNRDFTGLNVKLIVEINEGAARRARVRPAAEDHQGRDGRREVPRSHPRRVAPEDERVPDRGHRRGADAQPRVGHQLRRRRRRGAREHLAHAARRRHVLQHDGHGDDPLGRRCRHRAHPGRQVPWPQRHQGRLLWLWREKPRSTSWLDNSHRVMSYAISYRSTRGWNDGRGILGVQA